MAHLANLPDSSGLCRTLLTRAPFPLNQKQAAPPSFDLELLLVHNLDTRTRTAKKIVIEKKGEFWIKKKGKEQREIAREGIRDTGTRKPFNFPLFFSLFFLIENTASHKTITVSTSDNYTNRDSLPANSPKGQCLCSPTTHRTSNCCNFVVSSSRVLRHSSTAVVRGLGFPLPSWILIRSVVQASFLLFMLRFAKFFIRSPCICFKVPREFSLPEVSGRWLVCWHPDKSSIQHPIKVSNSHG
uniref:Uncharacterized protein LOC104250141 n=1 Tax=Nicotiana sylvestris TaxID=4096 RepID=A0A1U7YSU9_NICSY|nr:PREDICTED: uncharacterized protein LOC104250141 [Nicotiana sylvestris]